MNEIVWVCGNAAVGKETFIRHLTESKDEDLLTSLGWQNTNFNIIEESINWVAYDPKHIFLKKREEILEILSQKIKTSTNTTFLLKGQFVDLENHRQEKLLKMLPKAKHTILFLDADPETLFERLQKKPWFKEGFDIERVKKLSKYELNMLKKLDAGFRFLVVESGKNYQYKLKDPTLTNLLCLY